MKHRIAFAGFRHPHILALWRIVAAHPDCEIAGAWEADEATRHAPSGRDILERKAQEADESREAADAVIAEFFSKLRQQGGQG